MLNPHEIQKEIEIAKNCPFCGIKPTIGQTAHDMCWNIGCTDFNCREFYMFSKKYVNPELSLQEWNKRK